MPYLPKPQDHPTFRVYFTREWQEIYLTSLNNFLSIAFRQMHLPTLLSFVAEQRAVHVAPEHQSSSVSAFLLFDCGYDKSVSPFSGLEYPIANAGPAS